MPRRIRDGRIYFGLIATAIIFSIAPVKSAPAKEPAADEPRELLTKHEGETFQNQTVYISGQAFIRCKFVACTLVLRESVYHLEGCTFERCNWHIDCLIGWGSEKMVRELKALVSLMEDAQKQQWPQKP